MNLDTLALFSVVVAGFILLAVLILGVHSRLVGEIRNLDDRLDTNLCEIHGRLIRLETLYGLPGEDLAQLAESEADPRPE